MSQVNRVVVPTALVAFAASGASIVINLATEWKYNLWAWGGVIVVTLIMFAASLWLFKCSNENYSSEKVEGKVIRGKQKQKGGKGSVNVQVGGDGTITNSTFQSGEK